VARLNGASLTQRGDAAWTRKSDAFGKRTSSSRSSHLNQAQAAAHVSVTAGRIALGTIEQVEGGFVATSTGGSVVGVFPTLREAIAAIDPEASK
jgi:cysteine synthase